MPVPKTPKPAGRPPNALLSSSPLPPPPPPPHTHLRTPTYPGTPIPLTLISPVLQSMCSIHWFLPYVRTPQYRKHDSQNVRKCSAGACVSARVCVFMCARARVCVCVCARASVVWGWGCELNSHCRKTFLFFNWSFLSPSSSSSSNLKCSSSSDST